MTDDTRQSGSTRHGFIVGALSAAAASTLPIAAAAAPDPRAELAKVEAATGGRLGVVALFSSGRRAIAYRSDERFAMCSTFKLLAVAAILQRVDRGEERLDRHVSYGKSDIQVYAPVTSAHLRDGFMTVGQLCQAAIVYSDNTAANLLLAALGGPSSVTRFARTLGDRFTRLDRFEPDLNSAIPGDLRDTTTPAAMARDLRAIALGDVLSAGSRSTLNAWLVACRTGDELIRAGVPRSWRVGDKTGLGGPVNAAGASNTRNDIAVLWPPKQAAIVVTAYLTGAKVTASQRDAALARVGQIISAGGEPSNFPA